MEIIDYFERVRARTMRVVACVPPSSIDWTYRAGKFTLGDLIRHLASIERWMFAENAQRKPSRYPGHGRELADGYDAAIAYMREMHEQSMSIFRSLTEADLDAKCMTPGGAELTDPSSRPDLPLSGDARQAQEDRGPLCAHTPARDVAQACALTRRSCLDGFTAA
jgi:DinB superfamily